MRKYYKSNRTGMIYGYPADVPEADVWKDIDKVEEEYQSFGTALKDTALMGLRMSTKLVEGGVGLLDLITPGQLGKNLEDIGFAPGKAAEILKEYYSPEMQFQMHNLEKAMAKDDGAAIATLKEIGKSPQAFLEAAVTSGGPMILGGGIARAIPFAGGITRGAIGEGFAQAGSAHESIRQQSPEREISPGQSLTALGSGIGTGLLSFVGGKFAARLGITDIETLMADPRVQASAKGFWRRLVEGGLTETFEEIPQSAQEQMWENYALGRPLMYGVEGAATLGGAIGGVMGAGANILAPRNPLADLPPIEETKKLQIEETEKPVFTDSEVLSKNFADLFSTLEKEVDDTFSRGKALSETTPEPKVTSESTAIPDTAPDIEIDPLDAKINRDIGMTPEVRNNPHNFEDPNTSKPVKQRRIVRAMGLKGVTNLKYGDINPGNIDTSAGPVVLQIGEDNHVRPSHYLKGLIADIYQLAQEFNPRGIYVILPQDLGIKGDKKSERGGHFFYDGVHYIIPRHLTHQKHSGAHKSIEGEAGAYSPYANLDAYSTIGHEFGHSLIEDFFFEGLDRTERTIFETALNEGKVIAKLAKKLSPAAQAILKSWVNLRKQIAQGKILPNEAALRLLSPTKLWNKTLMREQQDFLTNYHLQFHEYLAEQVAKMMFTKERMEQSQLLEKTFTYTRYDPDTILGKMESVIREWLEPLFEKLQKVFDRLTAMGMAGPAESTEEWLDQLRQNALAARQNTEKNLWETLDEIAKAENPEANYSPYEQTFRSALANLWKTGLIKRNSEEHFKLARLLNNKQYEDFISEIAPYITEKLKFDITNADPADIVGWTPAWIVGHGGTNIWHSWPGAPFGRIDLEKTLTGEGNIGEGWGFYVAEAAGSYLYYAKNNPRPKEIRYKRISDGKFVTLEQVQSQITETLKKTPKFKEFLNKLPNPDGYLEEIVGHILERPPLINSENTSAKEKLEYFKRLIQNIINTQNNMAFENEFFPPENWTALLPAVKKAFSFRRQRGERNIRYFKILRPFEDFLKYDFNLAWQSPKMRKAILSLPEKYRKFFTKVKASGILLSEDNLYDMIYLKEIEKLGGNIIRQSDKEYIGVIAEDRTTNPITTLIKGPDYETVLRKLAERFKYWLGETLEKAPYRNEFERQVGKFLKTPAAEELLKDLGGFIIQDSPSTFHGIIVKPAKESLEIGDIHIITGQPVIGFNEDKSMAIYADGTQEKNIKWEIVRQTEIVPEKRLALHKLIVYLQKEFENAYQQMFGIEQSTEGINTPTIEEAYWDLVKFIEEERNVSQIEAAKITSKILASVGAAGVAYLNHDARYKHGSPPEFNTGKWNLVLYHRDNAKVIAKDTSLQKLKISSEEIGKNTARENWHKYKFNSENWKNWFAGSKAVTASGKPLTLFFNAAETHIAAGREFVIGAPSPVWMLKKNSRIIPGWMAIKNPQEIQVDSPYIPIERIQQDVIKARSAGHDGIIYKTPNPTDNRYVATYLKYATYDPKFKYTGSIIESAIRFDQTSPEGEETAKKWHLLRDTLKLPRMADAVGKLWGLQWSTLQMQQLAHVHPKWPWLADFYLNMQKFYRKVNEMHSRADAVIRQLQWLGKENLARMQRFTKSEYKNGKHWTELRQKDQYHWEHVPTALTYEKLHEFGIDPDTPQGRHFLNLYIEAKNALQYQMDEQQRALYELILRKYNNEITNPRLLRKLKEVIATFKLLREAPFWPQHSFGKYRIQVWTKDQGRKLLIVESSTDSETEAKEIEANLRGKFKDEAKYTIKTEVVTPEEGLLLRLPIEFLDELQEILGLDPNNEADRAKLEEIQNAMQSLYTRNLIETYSPLKKFVEGTSTDFIKVYADFALRNANLIAKIEFRKRMEENIRKAEKSPENQSFLEEKANIARAIEFMKRTMHYMMDPQEELTTLRGIVAISYLWGNVKTAILNFWGLMHTWAFLNRELGYIKGTSTFTKAFGASVRTQGHEWGNFINNILQKTANKALLSITDPNWEMINGKPTELRAALEQAKQENIIDQSYMYYLATQATRGNLIRMAYGSIPGKAFKGLIDSGMALFRGAELLIRRTTFLAVYETLQKTRPEWTPKQRYEEAARMVGLLQGDYTKGNRPIIMRGSFLTFITIFMTFVHNASWNVYGGMEMGLRRRESMAGRASPAFYRNYTVQLILLYLFAAGLEGLPFMENVLDILDIMFKKLNNGKSAREALREVLIEFDLDPMQVMRGWTFNVAGIDASRSIGLGRIVPGTDVLASEHGATKEFIGDFVTAFSGVGGGYIQWLIDTTFAMSRAADVDIDLGDTFEKQVARLPGGLGQMFKAAQWAEYDARGPAGGLLAYDEKTGWAREIQSWEIALKAMGFQPASISQGQLIKAAQYEARAFWTTRRKLLLDAYWHAAEIARDREALADVRQAIREFNDKVPSRSLRITQKVINNSMDRRKDAQKAANKFGAVQESLEDLYDNMAKSFALNTGE